MSKQKLGYEFVPFPSRLHPLWKDSTNAMLGLCLRLYSLENGKPIRVYGEWKEWLCKQMSVRGRERPITYRLLLDLLADGRLGVKDDVVTVCFRPEDELQEPVVESSSTCDRPVSEPSATGNGSNNPSESTAGNDSNHDRQIREEEKRSEEIRSEPEAPPTQLRVIHFRRPVPPAPPDLVDDESQASLTQRIIKYHQRRHLAALRVEPPDVDRKWPSKLAAWCIKSAEAYGTDCVELAKNTLNGLFESPRAAAEGFPLAWAANSPIQYAGPAPGAKLPTAKPLASTRPLENSGMYEELKPLKVGGE